MKNKKAFTIVELLAVITVLALIIGLLIPVLSNSYSDISKKISDSKKNAIVIASEKYANDRINDYQDCITDKNNTIPQKCSSKVSTIIQELIDNSYLSDDDYGYSENDIIQFCFNLTSVKVDAIYTETNSEKSCDTVTGVNYLKFISSNSITYGSKPITLGVMSLGLNGELTYGATINNQDAISNNSIEIERTAGGISVIPKNIDYGASNEVKVNVTARGSFGDNGKTLTANYEVTVKKVEFSFDEDVIVLEKDTSITKSIVCNNCGSLSFNKTDLVDQSINGDKLYIKAKGETGVETIEIKEANTENIISFKVVVFDARLNENIASVMNLGENYNSSYVFDINNMPEGISKENVTVSVENSSIMSTTLSGNNITFIPQKSGSTTVNIDFKIKDTINNKIYNCKTISKSITVGALSLSVSTTSIELLAGGKSREVELSFNNNNISLTCSSSDTDSATCKINNNTLTITSGNVPNDNVTITVSAVGYSETIVSINVKVNEITLNLSSNEMSLYAGNDSKNVSIESNANDGFACSSSNEKVATCEVQNKMLIVTPTSDESSSTEEAVTITVSNSSSDSTILKSAYLTVNVYWVKVDIKLGEKSIYDGRDGHVCHDVESDTADEFSLEGANNGTFSIGNYDTDADYYLVDASLINNKVFINRRTNAYSLFPNNYDYISLYRVDDKNTGISKIKILESNINKEKKIYYHIYSIEFIGDNSINVGEEKDIKVRYSYTGYDNYQKDDYVPDVTINNNKLEKISVSNPTVVAGHYGANENSDESKVNIVKEITVRVKGKQIGNSTINYQGELCGNKSFNVEVRDSASCPTVSGYSGIYDGNNKSISIVSNPQNGTAEYSLDGSAYSSSLPLTSSVGEHTVGIKVIGSEHYDDVNCSSVNINIRNAKITFVNNTSGTLSGSTNVYVRKNSNSIFNGEYLNTTTNYPTVSKSGYDFDGWYDVNNNQIISASGQLNANTTYTSSSNWNITSDINLYASISPKRYTITYDANGGSGAPSNQIITFGTSYTLSSIEPTRNGYTFLGWSEDAGATNYTFETGQSDMTYYRNMTLYAVWRLSGLEANSYSVGQEVKVFGLDWLVVKDESDRITLVLKDNYTTGVYGTSATFEGSTIFNSLNSSFVSSTLLGDAINQGLLAAQGTYNSSNYFVRLLDMSELSTYLPLSRTDMGSLFWTKSSSGANIYLGESDGSLAMSYFNDTTKGTQDLYAHQEGYYSTGGLGNTIDTIETIASANDYWTSSDRSTLTSHPNNSSVVYYNSGANTSGSACKDLSTISVTKCYCDWSRSGRQYWYYGPLYDYNSTIDTDNYLNLNRAQTKEICLSSGTTLTVYYAEEYTQCDLPFISFSSNYHNESVQFATNPITYYIPTETPINTYIGYRPVITVRK